MMQKKYFENWHLAKNETEFSVTEFEWALIRFNEAFSRYVLTTGLITVGEGIDLTYSEHVILHVVRMLNRPKTVAIIAQQINRHDIPNIQYSLRKLEAAGLISKVKERGGKSYFYTVTPRGIEVTDSYYQVKQELIFRRLDDIAGAGEKFAQASRFLSLMTGIYEEAARETASFTPSKPF